MAGIDLTDRIRMLDRMAQKGAVPSVFSPVETETEEKAETELLAQIEIEETEEIKTAPVVPVVPVELVKQESETPEWALELISAVEDLKNEVAKMNKHVNSIQKFIKKAK